MSKLGNEGTIGSEGGKGKNERWLARERDGWCREDGRLTDLEARFTRPRPSEKWMARRRYPRHERRQREMARFRGVEGRYGYLTWRWSGVQCREMIREDRMWQVLNLFRRQCKWIRWCAAVGDGTDLCQTRDFRDWIVDGNRGIWNKVWIKFLTEPSFGICDKNRRGEIGSEAEQWEWESGRWTFFPMDFLCGTSKREWRRWKFKKKKRKESSITRHSFISSFTNEAKVKKWINLEK